VATGRSSIPTRGWRAACHLAVAVAVLASAANAQERRIERVKKGGDAAAAGGRWAVIVGVDQYQSPEIEPLAGAVADARAIKEVLVKHADFPEGQVFLLVSDGPQKPTPGNIMEQLEQIKLGAKPGDLLLVFFAGHGVQVDGQRYLLTYDSKISSTASLKTTSLPATMLMQELESIPVEHRLIMVDACRNDPTQEGRPNLADEAFEAAFTLRPSDKGGVRATFLSCSRGQSAYEWQEKRRGFFSYFIEQGLTGEAAQFGKVTVTSLLTYLNEMVPQKVREQRNKLQVPYARVDGSQLVLVRAAKAAATSGLDAAAAVAIRTLYGVVKDSAGVPLVGAAVHVLLKSGGRSVTAVAEDSKLDVTTDEDGFFKIDGVPADVDATVVVAKDGYLDRTVTASPKEAGKKLTVFLPLTAAPVQVAQAAPPPKPSTPPAQPAGTQPAHTTPAPAPAVPPTQAPAAPRPEAPAKPAHTTPPPAPAVPPTQAPAAPRPTVPAKPARTTPAPAPAVPPTQAPAAPRPTVPAKTPPAALPAVPSPVATRQAQAAELAQVAYRTFLVEDFVEAEAMARLALDSDPDNPLAHAVIGNSLAAVGINTQDEKKVDVAKRHVASALQLDPDLALAHNAQALVFWSAGSHDAAKAEVETAVRLDPQLAPALANLAYVLKIEGHLDEAERAYRRALALDPESAVPYNGLSDVLLQRGKYKDAVKASRDAISHYELRDRNLGLFYVQLAVAQYQWGKWDEAKESVGRAKALGVGAHPSYQLIEKGKPKKKS
jgi:uncharacterized caspase-like protein/Tfp pilus assembly protein PilF